MQEGEEQRVQEGCVAAHGEALEGVLLVQLIQAPYVEVTEGLVIQSLGHTLAPKVEVLRQTGVHTRGFSLMPTTGTQPPSPPFL